ncbi:hypothetical protein DFP73DRAFT_177720 [Morchella snyderi]|nr:hypothetical protein DFP73DRAFT_177720 [Morchella snyderi]
MAYYTNYNPIISPRRLADRRGIPQLQPLEPAYEAMLLHKQKSPPSTVMIAEIRQHYSPLDSTHTEVLPFRSVETLKEEDEEDEVDQHKQHEDEGCDCDQSEGGGLELVLGLGVCVNGGDDAEVEGITRQTSAMRLTKKLHVATGGGGDDYNYEYHQSHYHSGSHHHNGQTPMPLTPPSNDDERPYPGSDDLIIDPDCFTSSPTSAPQSPASEASRSRAATILNKVVPYKLRASFKRRLSGPNTSTPPVPALSTLPNYYAGTPPPDEHDTFDDFFRPSTNSPASPHPPAATSITRYPASPIYSPLTIATDVFPEMYNSHIPSSELVSSPLHPPTISPLMSPTAASASQTSLHLVTSHPTHTHKKVPSIDPATPLAPRRPSAPVTAVTADSLADMIEEMNADLTAYDTAYSCMIESGWSSPQELRNVELQRKDKEAEWRVRIAESKKVLEHARRVEVMGLAGLERLESNASGASGVSVGSVGSESMGMQTLIPVTVLPVGASETGSLRSLRGSERTMSR